MRKLEFLDHVAIRVRDVEMSVAWYQKVLGLSVFQPEAWKPVPVMLLAGDSGIALFQAEKALPKEVTGAFHFAFRASRRSLPEWQKHLDDCEVKYTYEHHEIFESLYVFDPDGYKVEITVSV